MEKLPREDYETDEDFALGEYCLAHKNTIEEKILNPFFSSQKTNGNLSPIQNSFAKESPCIYSNGNNCQTVGVNNGKVTHKITTKNIHNIQSKQHQLYTWILTVIIVLSFGVVVVIKSYFSQEIYDGKIDNTLPQEISKLHGKSGGKNDTVFLIGEQECKFHIDLQEIKDEAFSFTITVKIQSKKFEGIRIECFYITEKEENRSILANLEIRSEDGLKCEKNIIIGKQDNKYYYNNFFKCIKEEITITIIINKKENDMELFSPVESYIKMKLVP